VNCATFTIGLFSALPRLAPVRFSRAYWAVLICIVVSACSTSLRDRQWVDRELQERVGATMRGGAPTALPSGVYLEDGLDEGELVSVALWRNPSLLAELTRIDAARASLDEARRPANPQITVLGNFGPVSAVATLLVPLESLWQTPTRTKMAAREADATAESVLMRALDLVRDVRLLHVELGLATDRVVIRRELATISAELARISAVRARLGDVSPLEERLLSAEAQTTADAIDLAETEVKLSRARLAAQLAFDEKMSWGLRASFSADAFETPGIKELVAIARAARPDVRAAQFAVDAAMARAGWERTRAVSFSTVVEGHWNQPSGPAARVGGRTELPIFGANPGGIGRADAEVARVSAQHKVVAYTTVLEVTTAWARALQAARSRKRFEENVLPSLKAAREIATNSFESGDETYLVILDALKRSGDARLRLAELTAEQRRAQCELDRAIGARLLVARGVAERNRTDWGTP